MTPALPKQILEAVELAIAAKRGEWWSHDLGGRAFLSGVTWLYSHLTGLAEKGFDQSAAFLELERIMKHERINDKTLEETTRGRSTSVDLARWQHAQAAAKIAFDLVHEAAEAENARLRPLIERLAERLEATELALKDSIEITKYIGHGEMLPVELRERWDVIVKTRNASAAFLKDLTK